MIILLTVAIISSLHLSAQDSEDLIPGMAAVIPVDGYVILNDGDTIFGKVRWALKYVENNPVEIKFFAEYGATEIFNASQIRGFGNQNKTWLENNPQAILFDVEHYVSLPSYKKGKPVFYNRLIGGRVAVYQNRSSIILSAPSVYSDGSITGFTFTFSRKDGLMIGPDHIAPYTYINRGIRLSSYYVSKDGSPLIKVDRDNYNTMFKTLFGDCPAIDEEVKSNPGLLEFKNFLIIAEVYNQICEY